MRRTFNMGLGMIVVVPPPRRRTRTVSALASARARVVGEIVPRAGGEPSRRYELRR